MLAVRHFQERMRRWGRERQVVVLCLDRECLKDQYVINKFGGYVRDDGEVMHAVAAVKVSRIWEERLAGNRSHR